MNIVLGILLVVLIMAGIVALLVLNPVIMAVSKRNATAYFSGVLGYLFIVTFVVLAALLTFNKQFFANNLVNLDQLNQTFPMLLMFIVPAITMSAWADERKLGTDELLFTLPATDFEILIGKYLAVLCVFSVTLAFSITNVMWLGIIGSPDWGQLFATYFGYWLAGAAMLSAGMFASVLTSSVTVSFVVGALICGIPVFLGFLAPSNEFIRSLSLAEQFRDFGLGMIPFSSLFYFFSLTVFFLYLNLILISRRHWSSNQTANMGMQFVARATCISCVLISWGVVTAYATVRVDMTAEQIHSLSPASAKVLDALDDDNPVTIVAFLTETPPREYVSIRKRLVGLLRQYDRMAGRSLQVRFVNIEDSYQEEADEARSYGIEPEQVATERDGKRYTESIYLGVVISSGTDEVVVPFFGPGLPIEYELTRSVRTVSQDDRPVVGILETDAKVFGGFSMAGSSPEWEIVKELKKQFKVKSIMPSSLEDYLTKDAKDEKKGDKDDQDDRLDVLIAVMPSSLTDPEMQSLVKYVKAGKPTLIFDDPLPYFACFDPRRGVTNCPRMPKPSPQQNPMMMRFQQQQQAPPKHADGKATDLMKVLDIEWKYDEVVWDSYNPHPEYFNIIPEEFVFITPNNAEWSGFSQKSAITSGMQEVFTAFPGSIRPYKEDDDDFVPLLLTGKDSGIHKWDDITNQVGLDSVMPRQNPRHKSDDRAHVIAAHLKHGDVNVVFVADADLISNWIFQERERAGLNFKLDNVEFVLNAIDVLSKDESFVELRKRRAAPRTLLSLEKSIKDFVKKRNDEKEKAEKAAEEKRDEARDRMEKRIKEINDDESLDGLAKIQMMQRVQEAESKKFAREEEKINKQRDRDIEKFKATSERKIRSAEDSLRLLAVTTAPLPAIILAIVVLLIRSIRERNELDPKRSV